MMKPRRIEMSKPLSPAYLRTQAARCQRLSRMCMDLGTARDLRLMADEYLADAARIEQSTRALERAEASGEVQSRRDFSMRGNHH
jgi:hypothetical protein